ncbi:hypothetical protein C8J57DRAFT_1062206 [Mycena rebaudengoi]|nr:hypothetical protein C8J57DRAFT_1062206 [Mycena rebaudengoi]
MPRRSEEAWDDVREESRIRLNAEGYPTRSVLTPLNSTTTLNPAPFVLDSTNEPLPSISRTFSRRSVPKRAPFVSTDTRTSTSRTNFSIPWREIPEQVVQPVDGWLNPLAVGIVYLAYSPFAISPAEQVGELNFGIVIDPEHRGKGYAREAVQLVIQHAFDVKHCHRIQAALIKSPSKDRILSLLTQMRFGHEGTKRRSFFNPLANEWQDVTTLAILDTDWTIRTYFKAAPKSLWDELFSRHERERNELLRWEETQQRLKRSSSAETIRAVPPDTTTTDSESDAPSVKSQPTSQKKGKRRRLSVDEHSYHDADDSDDARSSDSDADYPICFRRRVRPEVPDRAATASPALSDSSVESVPGSVISYGSTSGSDWDMLESSSSSSAGDSVSGFSDVDE